MGNNVENNELEVSVERVNTLSENEVQSCNKMEPGGGSGTISPSESMLRGEIYRPFTYVYLDLNYRDDVGSIIISVDPSRYTENNYVLEVFIKGILIQSNALTKSELHQEKITLPFHNVRHNLDSFKQNAEFIELKIRNQSSSNFGTSLIRVYNPPTPVIKQLPQYGEQYILGNGVVLFDYHIDLVSTPKTIVKLNSNILKFKQWNIFYRPYVEAETNMFDLGIVLSGDKNIVEINLVSDCYTVLKSFDNITFKKQGERFMGLELRRMLNLSYDVLIDADIETSKNQYVQLYVNGEYIELALNKKDPITNKFKWNFVSKIGGHVYFVPKIVQGHEIVTQTNYYGFIDYKIDRVSFRKEGGYGILDFNLSVPVITSLGHELTLTINKQSYFVKKIDEFNYQCHIKQDHIKEHYNEVVLTVYDHKKEEVLYKGSLFFHDEN